MVDESVRVLTPDQAWDLLGVAELGRIALSVDGQPAIFPVNFHATDGRIMLRSG